MNKRGAIELSMTTIIIIVIGITILVLGLAWVRNMLGGASDLTQKALEGGQQQISEIMGSSTDPLTLYTTKTELERSDWTQIAVIVFNDQGVQQDLTLTTAVSTSKENSLDCYIADSGGLTDSFTLDSGATEDEVIVIEDGGSPLGLYVCNVELTDATGNKVADASITVEIV